MFTNTHNKKEWAQATAPAGARDNAASPDLLTAPSEDTRRHHRPQHVQRIRDGNRLKAFIHRLSVSY